MSLAIKSQVEHNLTCFPKELQKVNILTFADFLRWAVINLCFCLDLRFHFLELQIHRGLQKQRVAIMYSIICGFFIQHSKRVCIFKYFFCNCNCVSCCLISLSSRKLNIENEIEIVTRVQIS